MTQTSPEDEADNGSGLYVGVVARGSSSTGQQNHDHPHEKTGRDDVGGTDCRSLDDFLIQASLAWNSTAIPSTCSYSNNIPWSYIWIFVSLGVGNSSDASEILCLAYILSESDFQTSILHHTPWRASLLASAVFFGMLVGGLVVGALGDSQGRRKLLLFGLATNCITGLLSAGATNVILLSILRLVAGIGIGATVPPLFTLCSELSPPNQRGFWVTVAASFWMIGSIYVAIWGWIIMAWLNMSWRLLAAVCALPSGLGFVMVYIHVPESPRFLVLQGQYEATLFSLRRLAKAMQFQGEMLTKDELVVHYPLSDIVLAPSSASSSLSSSSRFGWHRVSNACRDFWNSASLLYVASLRSTTVNLQIIWFALSFGSYGLLTWINTLFEQVHLQNVYTNALLFALANLPGNLLSAVLMDKGHGGRAKLLTGSLLIAALSLVLFAISASENIPNRAVIVSAACTFQACSVAAWNAVDVLSSELFPTQVRATGMGLCAASGRLGAMLAQGVNGYLIGAPVRLLLVAASTLLIGAISPKWLPDATGQPVVDRVVVVAPPSSSTEHDGLSLSERSSERRNVTLTDSSTRYSYQRVQTGESIP